MHVVFLGVMLTNGQKGGSMEDLISRKVAIDEIKALYEWHDTVTEDRTIDHLKRLPPAQPETHDKRTETHACDLISRQEAIEAHYEYCNKHPDASFPVWSLKILEDLPPAQPEPTQVARDIATILENEKDMRVIADISEYSDKLWKAAYERGKAEARRKKGHWIRHPEQRNIFNGKTIECSECHEKYTVQYVEDELFCRHCGADMREDGEADDSKRTER